MSAKSKIQPTRAPSARQGSSPRERRDDIPGEPLLELLARSADGVYAVDKNQRITFLSEAAAKLLGRPASELVGKYCYDVILGRDDQGHPFCRPNCPTIEAAKRGRGVPDYDIACHGSGKETWLNVSIVPAPRNMCGDVTAIHMIRDVSRRVRSARLAQAAIDSVNSFASEAPTTELKAGPRAVPSPSLTAREMEVLRLLADGLKTQEIARKLGISPATARNHIQRLLPKLGAHGRLEAVLYASRHNLI